MSRAPRPTGDAVAGVPTAASSASQSSRSARVVDEDLEAVLARVAGPRDERRDAGDVPFGDGVVAQRGQVDVGQRREDARPPADPGRDQRPVASERSSRTRAEAG